MRLWSQPGPQAETVKSLQKTRKVKQAEGHPGDGHDAKRVGQKRVTRAAQDGCYLGHGDPFPFRLVDALFSWRSTNFKNFLRTS